MAERLTTKDLRNALGALNWEHVQRAPADVFVHWNKDGVTDGIISIADTIGDELGTNTFLSLRRAIEPTLPNYNREIEAIPTYTQIQTLFEVYRKLEGFIPADDYYQAKQNEIDVPRIVIEEAAPGSYAAYSPDIWGCLATGGISTFDITDKFFYTMYVHMAECILSEKIGRTLDTQNPPKEQQN